MDNVVESTKDLQKAQADLERLRADLEKYLSLTIDDAAVFQRQLDVRQKRIGEGEGEKLAGNVVWVDGTVVDDEDVVGVLAA